MLRNIFNNILEISTNNPYLIQYDSVVDESIGIGMSLEIIGISL